MKENARMLDCFGDMCPLPLLRIEAEIPRTGKGDSFVVVTDHSCVLESIKDKYKDKNITMEIEEVMNGVWEITFTKL
ncbi:MAG: sulfurtransferase TusA family protein [Clostridia bacterium]|nr:sulfurtransferase TusA family protein [Clostridia bacterium]